MEENDFTAEVYALDARNLSAPLGARLQSFLVQAGDAKEAFGKALDAARDLKRVSYFVVVFSGPPEQHLRRPAAWTGTWSILEWEALREKRGGIRGFEKYLLDHFLASEG